MAEEQLNQELLDATDQDRLDPARVEAALANGADAACRNGDGLTPLINAACKPWSQAVLQLLLDRGCPVDAQDNDGWTALMYSVMGEHVEGVRVLMAAGADRSLRHNEGGTAEDIARRDGNPYILAALLQAPAAAPAARAGMADQAQLNLNKELFAATGGTGLSRSPVDPVRVESLLARGADAACRNGDGETPLINAAIMKGSAAVFQLLLDRGCPVDAQNKDGWTALMYSSATNNAEGVRVLLAARADRSLRTSNGCTAEDYARVNGHTDIVALLQAPAAASAARADPVAAPALVDVAGSRRQRSARRCC